MSQILKLSFLASFSSPLTYGVGLVTGQNILVRDSDATLLLGLTALNPNTGSIASVFVAQSGNPAVQFDVTAKYPIPRQWGAYVEVVGQLGVGKVLRVLLPRGGSVTGNWTRNGVNIAGATGMTYTQQQADVTNPASQITFLPSSYTPPQAQPLIPQVPPVQVFSISGSPVLAAQVGASGAFTITPTNAVGAVTYAFNGTIPAGLSLNTSTGAVTGNYTTAATYSNLNVTATDSVGNVATLGVFSVTVSAASTGTVQLSSSAYAAAEGTATVTITVTRTNGSSGAASVNYATSNGSATAGSDYTSTSGTLNWTNGDAASKTFTIPITDDSTVDAGETFTVTLSGATGAALGTPATATVTITDNDVAGNTRARFGYGTATAGVGGTAAALFAGMTQVSNPTTDINGTMALAAPSGQYTWVAVLQSAIQGSSHATGMQFNDGSGFGGFSGANSSAQYQGLDTNPTTEHQTYTDGSSNVWWLFRSNNASLTGLTITLS